MEDLFGIKMQWIMYALLAVFVPSLAVIGFMGLRNRVMLKMALRNIPRRKAQTVLIIVGIMISTLIMAASFGTGDTLTHSIRKGVVDGLGTIDQIVLSARAGESDQFGGAAYVPMERFTALQRELAGDRNIDGLAAGLAETAPTVNDRTGLSEGRMQIAGVDPATLQGFGGFQLVDGGDVRVDDLARGEVFINSTAADELEARAGDTFTVYLYGERAAMTVKGVVESGGNAGSQPTLLLPLSRAQQLFGREGEINSIVVSNRGDEFSGAELSEEVTRTLRVLFTDRATAAQLKAALATPEVLEHLGRRADSILLAQETRDDLDLLQAELVKPELSDDLMALFSDEDVRAEMLEAVAATNDPALAREVGSLLVSLAEFTVSDIKRTLLDTAEQAGSTATSFFILFGLFSIMVGILLIFLIFVMLAAARRSELGMARAVGARRWHLVQMFVFEGTAYSLVSGIVGVGLGLLASTLIVGIINQIIAGSDEFQLTRNFEFRSIVVAYCLGMVITFITVGVSAYRVSRMNIVAAVRDLPAPQEVSARSLRDLLLGPAVALALPLRLAGRLGRTLLRGQISQVPAALGQLALSPLTTPAGVVVSIVLLLSRPISQGWLTFIIGGLVTYWGTDSDRAALVRIGVTLVIIGVALMLRWLLRRRQVRADIADRVGYTLMGVAALGFWLIPVSSMRRIFGEMNGGIEMFFISGITMVGATVVAVMYNADLLLKALTALASPLGSLRPVLVTAVAYPMSNKFRTGITLAMFALVIFTMIVMSILTEAFGTTSGDGNDLAGGWDVSATVNLTTPIEDLRQSVAENPNLDAADFAAIGGYTNIPIQARQIGAEEQSWEEYLVRAADDEYLATSEIDFHLIAEGYGITSGEVMAALRNDPNLAVVDSLAVPTANGFAADNAIYDFRVEGLTYEDESMQPIPLEIREPNTGVMINLTVIAVMERSSDSFSTLGNGMIMGRRQVEEAAPFPIPATNYRIKAAAGADPGELARGLESAFQSNGMETAVISEVIEESMAANRSFNYLLTGFMGLGLMVGVASLGVVSLRAVVERRQQIGVLRAIGYKRRMVQLSFLLESSFVVLLGVAIGVGLGTVISWLIVREIRQDIETIRFTIPWLQIIIIIIVAYLFSLTTTFLPARQASNIYPAEALRYE